jgi:hypothetical protein
VNRFPVNGRSGVGPPESSQESHGQTADAMSRRSANCIPARNSAAFCREAAKTNRLEPPPLSLELNPYFLILRIFLWSWPTFAGLACRL